MSKYSFELFDENLQVMEIDIPDSDNIDETVKDVKRIARENNKPITTLFVFDNEDNSLEHVIDILL